MWSCSTNWFKFSTLQVATGGDLWSFFFFFLCPQVVHHFLSVCAISHSVCSGEGQFYTFLVLLSEITTPGINLRWYQFTSAYHLQDCNNEMIQWPFIFCFLKVSSHCRTEKIPCLSYKWGCGVLCMDGKSKGLHSHVKFPRDSKEYINTPVGKRLDRT